MIMTQDKARKTATRQRMAPTGEPYCEARRAAEAEADPGGDGRGATPRAPREEDWYARMAEEAGLSVAEVRAQEIAAQARVQAAEARERAEQAEELAERARERAEHAEEAAMMAHDAADLAAEAAAMTRGWADPDEQEQAQRRAEQARAAARRRSSGPTGPNKPPTGPRKRPAKPRKRPKMPKDSLARRGAGRGVLVGRGRGRAGRACPAGAAERRTAGPVGLGPAGAARTSGAAGAAGATAASRASGGAGLTRPIGSPTRLAWSCGGSGGSRSGPRRW